MESLNKFVEMWERTKDIEDMMSRNIVLPRANDVQAYLSTLSDDEHKRIRSSLDDALKAISLHTSGMEAEAKSLKEQIENNIQVSNACLIYNKVPRKPRS